MDLLREYFNSEEFKKSVHKLKIDDQEPDEYINEYCAKAQGYINFFQSWKYLLWIKINVFH